MFFLFIIFSNSCQLTTSNGENKSLINENVSESDLNNEKKIVEKTEDKSNEDIVKKTQQKNKDDKEF